MWGVGGEKCGKPAKFCDEAGVGWMDFGRSGVWFWGVKKMCLIGLKIVVNGRYKSQKKSPAVIH
jgi:hypothetical protein